MPRLYLSSVVGDGTPRDGIINPGNPFRPKAFDYPSISSQVIQLPSNPNGTPIKNWVLLVVDALDYSIHDADPDLTALAELIDLDTTITNAARNRINNVAGRLGIVTQAVTGETYRVFANRLLAELGAFVRL